MKNLRTLLGLLLCFSIAACSKRLSGTYEGTPPAMPVPQMPSVVGADRAAQQRYQQQMQSVLSSVQALQKTRLVFEGSKVRMIGMFGTEAIVPYRIKGDRLEIVTTIGNFEQLTVFTINRDGSLDGMMGHFVRVD
jgi:hypothetical protein